MARANHLEIQGNRPHMDPVIARSKLQSATRLHWFHWKIILFSLVLSFAAWRYSVSVLEAQIEDRFDRECDQVVELVQERMEKYEDALWGGAAMVRASGGDIEFDQWQEYVVRLNIVEKYPGINGIGVIHALNPEQLPQYLSHQRKLRPDFDIHPPHSGPDLFPISYIVPVDGNEKALGLDMAHERNRYSAAKKSRDTGQAQITGPINLVQYNDKAPGFLFYVPLYRGGVQATKESRASHFHGLVYAPFVVSKLMRGTLEKEKRHVGIRLCDDESVLYDEHVQSEPDFDPDPMYKRTVDVSLYGRSWSFDVWSTVSFREATDNSQPTFILLGCILIDGLLIFLFVSISHSSQKALNYADSMTHQLELKTSQLEKSEALTAERARQLEVSNENLEQFACVASHDLQEPLRRVAAFCGLLQQDYDHVLDDEGRLYVNFAIEGASRMRNIIQDLLAFSKIGAFENPEESADATRAFENAKLNLAVAIDESKARITHDQLPIVNASESHLTRLFQNLVGNAIKYRGTAPPKIHVAAASQADHWLFSVSDNGIGIEPEFRDRIFGVFKRLHSKTHYEGTGIGLAICKKIVERQKGRIWVESGTHGGCKFCFTIPKNNMIHGIEIERNLEYANA